MRFKRSHYDIMCAMLKRARKGAKKTQIMYAGSLSFSQLQRYLKAMNDEGLMEKNGNEWFTTSKGKKFVEAVQAVQQFFGVEEG